MTEAVEIWIKANEAMKRAGPIDGHDAACTVIARALRARDERIAEWRQDEVQAIGAAISTRNWQALERSYNSLRDKMDRHAIHVFKEKNDDA